MKSLWKYLKILCILIVLGFLFLINFWNTDYEPLTAFENIVITTTTEPSLSYTIIDFPCSSSINKLIIENSHIVVHFRSSNTGYIYRLNTNTNSFEEIVKSYADCGSGLSAGSWINSFSNGLISNEPNWKTVKFYLHYCLDYYC